MSIKIKFDIQSLFDNCTVCQQFWEDELITKEKK